METFKLLSLENTFKKTEFFAKFHFELFTSTVQPWYVNTDILAPAAK